MLARVRFAVSHPAFLRFEPLTGRLILVLAKKDCPKPRLTISPYGPPIFGLDIEKLLPCSQAIFENWAEGYAIRNLENIPKEEYFVQTVLSVYTRYKTADDHMILIHLDLSFGSPFNASLEILYWEIKKIYFDLKKDQTISLELSKIIPDFKLQAGDEWLKPIWTEGGLLSEFWRHPICFGMIVLLPKGYNDSFEARYTVVFVFKHEAPFSFNLNLKSHELNLARASDANMGTGYEFYQAWVSEKFPRFIAVTFNQPTPYFPSSYSIDLATCGSYAYALLQELIPYLEKISG